METISFRDSVKSQISAFLYDCNFDISRHIKENVANELVDVVNQLSDYYEEGTHLYPEIVLMRSFDEFKTSIPCFSHVFYTGNYNKGVLMRAIKMCAPLAQDGWHIFIEFNDENVRWGVVNGEESVTSVSVYRQVVDMEESPFVYIRNVGAKTVELSSGKHFFKVSLSLKLTKDILKDELSELCDVISSDCQTDKELFATFLSKQINSALQKGHGNLIVVQDLSKSKNIPEVLKEGVSIQNYLDIYGLFVDYQKSGNDLSAHTKLQKDLILVEAMLNHDGITVFSTDGKILGYHFIVDNNTKTSEQINGGARTKAFSKLCQCMDKGFVAVFMKTQEGNVKFKAYGK